jgi:hypothetical protein
MAPAFGKAKSANIEAVDAKRGFQVSAQLGKTRQQIRAQDVAR